MNTTMSGALRQARIQTRIELLSWTAVGWLIWPAIGLFVLFFLRDSSVMGSAISLAQLGIPGVAAMYLVTGGLMGISGGLMQEREDGTLLRAKAVPGAMGAHLLSGLLTYGAVSLLPTIALVGLGGLLVEGIAPSTPGRWALFLAFCILGLAATMPAGALLGAALSGPLALGIVSMGIYATMAISGLFYPLASLPTWLQWIGQVLPTYWLGVGLRAAMLPPAAAALEMGGTFHTGTAAVVLLVWTVVGLALAPGVLRRMVRRQSGSVVAAARDRVMAKGY